MEEATTALRRLEVGPLRVQLLERIAQLLCLALGRRRCRLCRFERATQPITLSPQLGRLLRRRVNELAGEKVTRVEAEADGMADLGELDAHTLRRLDMLGPFGAGNPRPTFASRVKMVGRPSVDSRGQDLRFRVV